VWVPGEDEGAGEDGDLRGIVERIATGETDPFRSAEELTNILRSRSKPEGGAESQASG